jgi:hypothetical protein
MDTIGILRHELRLLLTENELLKDRLALAQGRLAYTSAEFTLACETLDEINDGCKNPQGAACARLHDLNEREMAREWRGDHHPAPK